MISFKHYLQETITSGFYYHGTNSEDTIDKFNMPSDNEFRLFGNGVYFFKNKNSAKEYGKYIYKVKINKSDYRLLDADTFELTPDHIEGLASNIAKKFDSSITKSDVIRYTNVLDWFIEIPTMSKFQFKSINDVRNYIVKWLMAFHSFDGISIQYPGRGYGIVIWNENKLPKPIDVIIED